MLHKLDPFVSRVLAAEFYNAVKIGRFSGVYAGWGVLVQFELVVRDVNSLCQSLAKLAETKVAFTSMYDTIVP